MSDGERQEQILHDVTYTCRSFKKQNQKIKHLTDTENRLVPFSRGSSWPGIRPDSPALQADSWPLSPQGCPPAPINPARFGTLLLDSFISSSLGLQVQHLRHSELNKHGPSEPRGLKRSSTLTWRQRTLEGTVFVSLMETTDQIPDSLQPELSLTSQGRLSTQQEQIIPEELQKP